MKEIKPFHFWPLRSTQLTDFSYADFTVSYKDALDGFRVRLNIILFVMKWQSRVW